MHTKLLLLGATTALGLAALSAPAQAYDKDKAAAAPAAGPTVLKSVDYVNAEVTDVIRALAAQGKFNVAMNPSVKGMAVTIHLSKVTVIDALQKVAYLAGLGARQIGDTYVVAPKEEMRATLVRYCERSAKLVPVGHMEPKAACDLVQGAFSDLTARAQGKAVSLIGTPEDQEAGEALIRSNDVVAPESIKLTERVEVKNRPAKEVVASLGKMVPSVSAEVAGNMLVLTGTKDEIASAKAGIELVDVAGQPDSESRVYAVRYAPSNQLIAFLKDAAPTVQVIAGPESNSLSQPMINNISAKQVGLNIEGGAAQQGPGAAGGPGGTGPGGGPMMTRGSLAIVLKGQRPALDDAMRLLAMVDVPPKQVHIEARVVETTPELSEQYGLKWSWTRFGFYEAPPGTSVDTSQTNGAGGDFTNFITRTLGFGAISRVPFSFQSILSAMITKRDAKLLASPQTSVVNDQDAQIFIGDTLRFQSLAQSSPTTGNQFSVVEVPVGIILLVHPRVNDDGHVTLRVHPVVSTVSGLVNGLPQTSAREADTTVRVKDGDTFVLGGLIRDEDIREMSKVPLLGDLPIVGHLFRSVNRDHKRSEVMVFLTVKILPG